MNSTENCVTAAKLKMIAYVTMIIDHLFGGIYYQILLNKGINCQEDFIYLTGRTIGRLAFPIFCFQIVEGMRQTKNRKKYLARLFLFAIISEVPYDLCINGSYWDMSSQNVFFTLFFGALLIGIIDLIKTITPKKSFWIGILFIYIVIYWMIECYLKSDYSIFGLFLILAFYFSGYSTSRRFSYFLIALLVGELCNLFLKFPNYFPAQLLNPALYRWYFKLWVLAELPGIFSLFIIGKYNGQKGKQLPKILNYCIYPAHLLVIGLVRVLLLTQHSTMR